jgi:DNA-binding NarL/FixJ family response regulator
MSLLILVVDTDCECRRRICCTLEEFGYSVITAEDGRIALRTIEQHQPHLIVTDANMPDMDGYELLRWLRQHPIFRFLPVIFLMDTTDIEERIRVYQLGGDAYLCKPFEFKELYAISRNLLEKSQQIWHLMRWELRLQIQEQNIERQTLQSPLTSQSDYHHSKPKDLIVSQHQILFTPREKEVIKLLADGLSNSQIASCLFLSFRTIEKYVSNLLGKTGTNNRVELARFAMEHKLID